VDEFLAQLSKPVVDDDNNTGDAVLDENTQIEIPSPIKLEWTFAPDTKIAVREACVEIDGYLKNIKKFELTFYIDFQ
jgi:hypothetical protein